MPDALEASEIAEHWAQVLAALTTAAVAVFSIWINLTEDQRTEALRRTRKLVAPVLRLQRLRRHQSALVFEVLLALDEMDEGSDDLARRLEVA